MSAVLWVGGENGIETDLLPRAGVPFTTIPAAGLHGVGWRTLPRNLWQLTRGLLASRRILRQFKPDVLLFTGGYVAAPMAIAGRNVPTLLYVPDIEPGLALKFLSRFSDTIAVNNERCLQYYPPACRTVITGYPVRASLEKWKRQEGRARLGLTNDLPVLLFLGGSKGARSINRALLSCLDGLLEMTQIVHLSGQLEWPEVKTAQPALPARLAERYPPHPYLPDDMGAALAAADLAVSRAGASTLGDYPLFGLPAILVPYPHAWRYQKVNAAYLAGEGAAVILEDAQLADKLFPLIAGLLQDSGRLASMRQAMKRLSRPQAAQQIAALISDLTFQSRRAKGGQE